MTDETLKETVKGTLVEMLPVGSTVWLQGPEYRDEGYCDVVLDEEKGIHAVRLADGTLTLPMTDEVMAVSVAWQDEHDGACPVTADRTRLADELQADPQNRYLLGALPEYDGGGDQEAEGCTCGAYAKHLVARVAAALEATYGPDPQEVGAVDGTEDDFGDLVSEAAKLLGRDPDAMGDEDWQHFQDVAVECRSTDMAGWVAHLQAITD